MTADVPNMVWQGDDCSGGLSIRTSLGITLMHEHLFVAHYRDVRGRGDNTPATDWRSVGAGADHGQAGPDPRPQADHGQLVCWRTSRRRLMRPLEFR